jgi:hypothetical protein
LRLKQGFALILISLMKASAIILVKGGPYYQRANNPELAICLQFLDTSRCRSVVFAKKASDDDMHVSRAWLARDGRFMNDGFGPVASD